MSLKKILFLILLNVSYTIIASLPEPLLVVLLMVRDEKSVIIPTLKSYLPKKIDVAEDEIAYIVYDTGSVDGTEKLAQKFFEDKGIKQFAIIQEPWIDYARSRNKALAHTREKFPESTFILFPDAEWYLQGFDELIEFCRGEKKKFETGELFPSPYYSFRICSPLGGSPCNFKTSRLFLTQDDVIFETEGEEEGENVHECPNKCSGALVPNHIFFKYEPGKKGAEKSKNRWFRDREKLLKRFLRDPSNPRTALYLGFTELWLENYSSAYTYLKHRVGLYSFPEEDYLAYYKLGITTMILASLEPNNFTWEEAQKYFLKAHSMRPHRAEPLMRIAAHYLAEDNHAISYLFAKRAADLALPENEILEVENYLYDYERWETLSRNAWQLGEYEVGENAAMKAIEARPNFPHLYRNLNCFWERKMNQQPQGN